MPASARRIATSTRLPRRPELDGLIPSSGAAEHYRRLMAGAPGQVDHAEDRHVFACVLALALAEPWQAVLLALGALALLLLRVAVVPVILAGAAAGAAAALLGAPLPS